MGTYIPTENFFWHGDLRPILDLFAPGTPDPKCRCLAVEIANFD